MSYFLIFLLYCFVSVWLHLLLPQYAVNTNTISTLGETLVRDVQLKLNLYTLNVQDWDDEAFPGSSKNNTIKASTKLFLFHRLKSKKQKNNKSSPKNQRENRPEDSAPEPKPPVSPKVFLNPVDCSAHL